MVKRSKYSLRIVIIVFFLWIAITSFIYRFSNTNKTETEAFLHIPKSFMLDFK